MKKEVYRCLRTLEAYKIGLMNMWANAYTDSAPSLQEQYSKICEELKKHLSQEEFGMIHIVDSVDFSPFLYPSEAKTNLINELVVSVEMTLAYLRSLDMDLSREMVKKELELKRKEEELRIKGDEVESLKKVYSELVHIKRGLPEIIRSEVVKEIKKQHREIEENTNPDTESQKKASIEEEAKEEVR